MINSPAPPEPAAMVRCGTLVEDRACIRCGFNLSGQPLAREPHYQLTIVRCPECSTVAGLQEYPLLGKWAGRWAALLAAVWFLVLIGGFAITTMIAMGSGISTTQASLRPLGDRLTAIHSTFINDQLKAKPDDPRYAGFTNTGGASGWGQKYLEMGWWNNQDPAALLAEAGGITANLGWLGLKNWLAFSLVMAGLGLPWSVALLGVRRPMLPVFALLPIVAAVALFATLRAVDALWSDSVGWAVEATSAAASLAGDGIFYAACAGLVLPFTLGLMIGRPVARGLVRWLLPPRSQAALGILWTADRLELPRPKR